MEFGGEGLKILSNETNKNGMIEMGNGGQGSIEFRKKVRKM